MCTGEKLRYTPPTKSGRAGTTRSAFRARHGIREFHPSPRRDSHFPAKFRTPPKRQSLETTPASPCLYEVAAFAVFKTNLTEQGGIRHKPPIGMIEASNEWANSGVPILWVFSKHRHARNLVLTPDGSKHPRTRAGGPRSWLSKQLPAVVASRAGPSLSERNALGGTTGSFASSGH